MPPIDYSAWDRIEISDDEDIECHPNVDKMSLVRWRQQKIRQERKDRRFGIERLTAQLAWLDRYAAAVRATPTRVFAASSPEAPPAHIVALIREFEGVPESILPPTELLLNRPAFATCDDNDNDNSGRNAPITAEEEAQLAATMAQFVKDIESHRGTLTAELARLRKEESMHLDIDTVCRPGFDSKTIISTAPKPKVSGSAASRSAPREIETAQLLNPKGVSGAAADISQQKPTTFEQNFNARPEEDLLITAADVYALAELPLNDFRAAERFLRENMQFLDPDTNSAASEQILASAFEHGLRSASSTLAGERAKIALHHDTKMQQRVQVCTMLQFLRDLSGMGGGPRAFFSKLDDANAPAARLFRENCESTIKHIRMRCKVNAEKSAGKMRSKINISGVSKLDFLRDFPQPVREALLSENLELLNTELGKLSSFESEKCLRLLRDSGVLRGESENDNYDENENETEFEIDNQSQNQTEQIDERLVSKADPALQKRLLKELPPDFAAAIMKGDAETINALLQAYSPDESERVLRICTEGDFLEVLPTAEQDDNQQDS